MTTFETQSETVRGRGMYDMLLAVHAMIRRDLEGVEELAAKAADGLSAPALRQGVDELKRDSMLWRLQVDCLRYCHFVHSHHNAEDRDFFQELRETNPAINPIVDRLQGDHRRVSDDLDPSRRPPGHSGRMVFTSRGGRSSRRFRPSARTCSSTSATRSSASGRRCCASASRRASERSGDASGATDELWARSG